MFVLADLNTERRSHTLPYFADSRFDYVSANVPVAKIVHDMWAERYPFLDIAVAKELWNRSPDHIEGCERGEIHRFAKLLLDLFADVYVRTQLGLLGDVSYSPDDDFQGIDVWFNGIPIQVNRIVHADWRPIKRTRRINRTGTSLIAQQLVFTRDDLDRQYQPWVPTMRAVELAVKELDYDDH